MPAGRHFLQIPGPTNVPDRVLRAIDRPDHRPSRPRVPGPRPGGARGHQAHLQDPPPGGDLPGLGHRRLGGRARQHAVARRQGADVRDRPLRLAVAQARRASSGLRGRAHPRRLAPRRGRRGHRGAARRGQGARHQGRVRRAQRDLHRRHHAHRRWCARPSTPRSIRRCCWSTPSPRSPRSTTATTSGASTSPSAARRRG